MKQPREMTDADYKVWLQSEEQRKLREWGIEHGPPYCIPSGEDHGDLAHTIERRNRRLKGHQERRDKRVSRYI